MSHNPENSPFVDLIQETTTGRRVSLSVETSLNSPEQWIREYTEGRKLLETLAVSRAQHFTREGIPMAAIAMSRIGLEIVPLGQEFFFHQSLVARAMGVNDEPTDVLPQSRDDRFRAIRDRNDAMLHAMHEVFDTPLETRELLTQLQQKARLDPRSDSADAWSDALNHFVDDEQLLAGGICADELAQLYEKEGSVDGAIGAYLTAMNIYVQGISSPTEIPSIAEHDQLVSKLKSVLSKVVSLISNKEKLSREEKEALKSATYLLDDTRSQYGIIAKGYRALARSSRWGERMFYNKQARDVMARAAIAASLQAGNVVIHPIINRSQPYKRP